MEAYERLCSGLSPERALARGFSITRTVEGRVIRSAADVDVGSRIKTQLAGGELASRVEES
jgi:exodeoxyribonuclease VII large subunit